MAAYGGCDRDVVHRMYVGYKVWGVLESVLSNRGLGIKAKKCLYEGSNCANGVVWSRGMGMRSAERTKVNVLEIKCLRSLVGVS